MTINDVRIAKLESILKMNQLALTDARLHSSVRPVFLIFKHQSGELTSGLIKPLNIEDEFSSPITVNTINDRQVIFADKDMGNEFWFYDGLRDFIIALNQKGQVKVGQTLDFSTKARSVSGMVTAIRDQEILLKMGHELFETFQILDIQAESFRIR